MESLGVQQPQMHIIKWNAYGIPKKQRRLVDFHELIYVEAVCIQWTKLKTNHWSPELTPFCSLRSDRQCKEKRIRDLIIYIIKMPY